MITVYRHEFKLVNRVFVVDTSFPQDIKGTDNQQAADPVVINQDFTARPSEGNHSRESRSALSCSPTGDVSQYRITEDCRLKKDQISEKEKKTSFIVCYCYFAD